MLTSPARVTALIAVRLVGACFPAAAPSPIPTSPAPSLSATALAPTPAPTATPIPSPTPDAVRASWTATGSKASAHQGHTATLLPDGSQLVPNGGEDDTALWAPTVDVVTARKGHTATLLLDGTVLVADGSGAAGHILDTERYQAAGGS